MDIISFNREGRIGFQLTPKNSKRSCIISLTYDNRLYIDSANENGEWLGPRFL